MKTTSRGRGYRDVKIPGHPMADKQGRVAVRRLVAAEKLGRPLTKEEVAHHRNEKKPDNRPENLQVRTRAEHTALHAKPRTLVDLHCVQCGGAFRRELRNVKKGSLPFCCRAHAAAFYVPKREKKIREHGNAANYRAGCRCPACRAANTERIRKQRNGK